MKFIFALAIALPFCVGHAVDVDLDVDLKSAAADAIKKKCNDQGGNGTFEKVIESQKTAIKCFQDLIDYEVITNELEEAKKTGSMDEVFAKYCAKKDQFTSCTNNFGDALKVCLNDNEKSALDLTTGVARQLFDFMCFKDGDRLALFVAEGGPECLSSHQEDIKQCVNSTFHLDTISLNVTTIPTFLIDRQKCDDLGKLQKCVVESLEKCKDSTPANIADALFKFIKKSACKGVSRRSTRSIIKRSIFTLPNMRTINIKFLDKLESKCLQNSPEHGYEKVKNQVDNTQSCLKEKAKTITLLKTPLSDIKLALQECTDPLVNAIQKCLPKEGRVAPRLLIEAISSALDYLYDYKDELFSVEFQTDMRSCFKGKSSTKLIHQAAHSCANPTTENVSYTKEAICSRIEEHLDCYVNAMKNLCPGREYINRVVTGITTASKKPCLVNH